MIIYTKNKRIVAESLEEEILPFNDPGVVCYRVSDNAAFLMYGCLLGYTLPEDLPVEEIKNENVLLCVEAHSRYDSPDRYPIREFESINEVEPWIGENLGRFQSAGDGRGTYFYIIPNTDYVKVNGSFFVKDYSSEYRLKDKWEMSPF